MNFAGDLIKKGRETYSHPMLRLARAHCERPLVAHHRGLIQVVQGAGKDPSPRASVFLRRTIGEEFPVPPGSSREDPTVRRKAEVTHEEEELDGLEGFCSVSLPRCRCEVDPVGVALSRPHRTDGLLLPRFDPPPFAEVCDRHRHHEERRERVSVAPHLHLLDREGRNGLEELGRIRIELAANATIDPKPDLSLAFVLQRRSIPHPHG